MSLGFAWARPLDTVWYIRVDGDESSIEGRLSRLLDENDGLIIQETRGEAVTANTGLRWFRPRRTMLSATPDVAAMVPPGTLVPFPTGGRPGRPQAGAVRDSDAAAA